MAKTAHDYLKSVAKYEKTAKDYCTSSNFDESYANIFPVISKKKLWDLSTEYDKTRYKSLKKAIRTRFGAKNIVFGSGTEDLIVRWGKLVTSKQQRVGIILPIFYRVIECLGTYDFKKINGLVQSDLNGLDAIFLSNPNPLTGKVINRDEILSFSERNPDITFYIDEASMFLLKSSNKYSLLNEAENRNNITVLSSFSKLYGLSGERVGMLSSNSKTVMEFENIGPTYPVSATASYILEYLLNFDSFFHQILQVIENNKNEVETKLRTMAGLKVFPSATNCVFFKSNKELDLFKHLLELGVISLNLDTQDGNKLPGAIRITIHSSPTKHKYLLDKLGSLRGKLDFNKV